MIERFIKNQIEADFDRKKVIVVLGARQVGKSTLFDLLSKGEKRTLVLNCDDSDDRLDLEDKSSTALRNMLSPYEIVFIDEAQRVANIGLTLKKIGDLKLDTIVIVTGSSSLDLADEVNEPATGRLLEYNLYPFSLGELSRNSSEREEQRLLEQRLIYGSYPEVVTHPDDAKRLLMHLTNNYLYRDLLAYKGVRKPEVLQKLVRALALQVGSEVSYNELSNLIGVDKETIENYINLLEKCFVIFRLDSFSRNLRNEIKKGKKVYFYDNGVRNAVISAFAPMELRADKGALWENLMISERIKRNSYQRNYANYYFWRTTTKREIDLIEEQDGQIHAYEFKSGSPKKVALPQDFADAYPGASFSVITPENYWEFVRL